MERHGPWVIKTREEKYNSEFLKLREDRVTKPDGRSGTYATVTLKPGVAVLPLDSEGQVHLTRQYRYAVGRDTVEVPSGTLEAGEDPLTAAKREILEELGIEADDWRELGCVDLDTSIVRCSVSLFVARELRFIEPDQDPAEVIRPLTVPFSTAVDMVMNGEITHAPSCVLMLKAETPHVR